MPTPLSKRKITILSYILSPIVRFCLRRRYTFQDFHEVGKRIFVEEGEAQLAREREKITVSRLSVLTGIRRKEISRIQSQADMAADKNVSILTRVIGLWTTSPRFLTASDRPKALTFKGAESEFSALVAMISTDVRSASVLAELERLGAVAKQQDTLRLLAKAYQPKPGSLRGYELLSTDLHDLIRGVEENILGSNEQANLHATTEFDEINPERLPQIRRWIVKQGMIFHEKVQKYLARSELSKSDKETTNDSIRVVVGSFSRIEVGQKNSEKEDR